MEWLAPVVLRVVLISGIFPVLLKGKIVQQNLVKRFFLQYGLCALTAVAVAGVLGQLTLSKEFLLMLCLGVFIGIGTYCNWLTTKLNLSATSLFVFFDDFLAITLGFVLLGELKFLTPGVSVGLLVCIIGIALFSYNNYRKKKSAIKKEHLPLRFFVYVAVFSTAWGIASFSQRYFALEGLGVGTYISGWYSGTFVAALIICLYKLGVSNLIFELRTTTKKRELGLMVAASGIIMLNVALAYWALGLAPLTAVQPIFYISALVLPLLIGLFVFKERKESDRVDWISYGLGIIGVVVIGISFSL